MHNQAVQPEPGRVDARWIRPRGAGPAGEGIRRYLVGRSPL